MAGAATVADLQRALRARDRAAINHAAVRLLDQRTPLSGDWFSVAQVLVRNGELSLAVAAAQRGVEECGESDRARFQLAHILSLVGQHEEAMALASADGGGQVNPVERDHFVGTCALELGEFERARDAFERVAAAWQGSGVTWLSLAALPPKDDASLMDRLDAARSTITSTPPDSRARWHYAKGAVLDRLGRDDEAFAEFAAGAELARAARPYDPIADHREADAVMAEFDRESIGRISSEVRTKSGGPILVTGLPRSGTTLVEQILASHSKVAGGGELPFGSILTREVGGNSLPKLESFLSEHGPDHLTELYLHLGEQRFGEGTRFVDKGLGASRQLGVLASALPQARIIWLRRDPLDCAWSCFRTYFSQGIEWSWSLTDIAAHFHAEDRLHAHWQDVLGERVLTISYEELAGDPESQIDRMLRHVGLDAEPGLESPHRSQRAVTTSSVAQVRQPISQSAVGVAQRYRKHLAPFIEAYGR